MSVDSSLATRVQVLKSIQKYVFQIGGPVLMFIGSVSCIINLIIFTKKNLRKSPCSIYFAAFNISNFLLIYSSILAMVLEIGYDSSIVYSHICCRLRMYSPLVFYSLSTQFLIMASIDRVMITSTNALTRRRSTYCLALKCIAIDSLFWILFHSHVLCLTDIFELAPTYYACSYRPGWYTKMIAYYSVINGLLSPLLLAVFGIWTARNIRNVRRVRVVHFTVTVRHPRSLNEMSSTCSKDRQLILMLLIDIVMLVCFCPLSGMFLMYQQFTEYKTKSIEQAQMEAFITYGSLFISYFPFCISCYTHLIVSTTFRKEVKFLFRGK